MIQHRFPVGDIKPHTNSIDCECNPVLYEGDRYDLCWHRAFDKREIVIEAEIAMGLRCEDCMRFINEKGEHVDPPPPDYEYPKDQHGLRQP